MASCALPDDLTRPREGEQLALQRWEGLESSFPKHTDVLQEVALTYALQSCWASAGRLPVAKHKTALSVSGS